LTLINASLWNDFNNGLESFATANNSCESLYKPTVVIYVLGSPINVDCATCPTLPVTYEGLLEKLYSAFFTLTK
jgi:hypothetical protein